MPGVLRWPFRIILYGMLYVVWAMVSLFILAVFPSMTPLEAINVLPAGWIPIAAVFLLDLYIQLKARRSERNPAPADRASPGSSAGPQ